MNIHIRRSCLSLVLLSAFIEAIRSNENENNSTDVRRGRVNGRIVKLYTGSKPDPVLCHEEGFKADPVDCSVFYRCTKASSTKYTVFRFQCGPGTVYDPETEICNHPRNTKRSECGGLVPSDNINDENEIEGFELPSPISTIRPVYTSYLELNNVTTFTTVSTIEPGQSSLSYLTTTSTSYPVVTTTKREVLEVSSTLQSYPWINSKNKSNEILTTSSPNSNNGFLCTSDGFIGDNEDCRKFYRCISNSRGGFTRHEFLCSESTVWDDNIQSCNHVWAVRNSPCVRNGLTSNKLSNLTPNTEQPLPYGMKVTQQQNKVIYNEYKVNYDHKIHKDEPDKFQKNDVSAARPSIVQNEVINENEPSKYETISSSTETLRDQTIVSNYTRRNTECAQTGFMGNPYDCSKFYRCVDNGRGSFSKFEFSCGQGTVWDSKAEACNHAWAVKECGKMYPVKNDPTTTIITAQYQTKNTTVYPNNLTTVPTKYEDKITTISTINEDNDSGYGNPLNQQSQLTSSTVLTTISLLSTTTSPEIIFTECRASGFYGDLNDCDKFYRCVDDGKGSFTKYEYKCGQGTLWDQEIEACNHARVVKSCNQNPAMKVTKSTERNDIQTSTVASTHIQTTSMENSQNNDSDFGYHTPQIEMSGIEMVTDLSALQATPIPSVIEQNKCQSTGFIGDSKDCKKFYRCVDNGKGGFTQFQFSCGEGTAWDSEVEACNHEWAVKQCGGNKVINISTSSTTINHDTINEVSNVYTTQSYDTQGTTTTLNLSLQTSTTKLSSECITDGFVGDKYDCKKFYRCVESGNGSFIRYEYLCGDGTVWDPEIQACNHEREVKECGTKTNTQSTQSIHEIYVTSTSSPNYNNEVGYTTQTSKQPSLIASTTKHSSMTTVMNNGNESNYGCQSSGFMGDNYDCKKFYRCVDNGKGGFTKYEFTCGEGTVWDSKIEACNHEWAAEKCGGNNQNETTHSVQIIDSEHEFTTPLHISNTTTQTLQSNSPVYSTTSSSMQTELLAPDKENKCTSEGFFANYKNCRKFFRCVNDGKGGYTKFEFDCGEGTVWVQEMQVCDHETDETKCSYSLGTTTDSYKEITEAVRTTVQTKPVTHNEQVSVENISTTLASTTLSTTIKPKPESSAQNVCYEEGYFGDSNNCEKFYRCVDNEKGGYTKYDFTCGEGTVWDQNIVACNHPQDVTSTTCKSENENVSSTISSGSTQYMTTGKTTFFTTTEKSTISTTTSSSEATYSSESNTPTESSTIASTIGSTTSNNGTNANCNNNSTDESKNKIYKCEKAGFHANPNDCKKYYRCVDWESNGQNFSVFHFECGTGTIWDPALETCNHEDSVYPPRNCNGTQQQNENVTDSTTTTEIIYTTQQTTKSPQTTQQTSTTEKSTTQQVTDKTSTQSTQEQTTTSSTLQTTSLSTEQTTLSSTEQTTSSTMEQATSSSAEQTTPSSTEQTTSSSTEQTMPSSTEQTTSLSTEQTMPSSTEQTTSSSTEQTTPSSTEQTTSSSTEQTTPSSTEQITSSSTEQTTSSSTAQTTPSSTEQITSSNTEQTTSSSTEQTTTSSTEQITSASTEDTSSVENSTTTESTTGTTQLTSVSTDQTTTEKDNTTTEYSSTSDSSTTQMSEVQNTTPATSSQECLKTDRDESLFVCPTSFRRHPKFCNLFYQCTEDNDNHEVKIAVFNCPNNTIYDETKIQCVEEEKSDIKCKGQIAQRHRVKRLGSNFNEPMIVTKESMACPTKGHFPFESHEECSEAMLKCQPSKSGKLRGYVYRCPEGFVYWVVSRRCEPIGKVQDCKMSSYPWNRRYDLPVENSNIAS